MEILESTEQVSPEIRASASTPASLIIMAVEELDGSGGDHYATPPESPSEESADGGEILPEAMLSGGAAQPHAREGDGDQDILRRARGQPEGAVWLPLFLRHFSDARQPSTRTRLYQVWPGRNVFFLRGHIICGPDPRGFLLTSLSILVSTWIFCFYVAGDSPEEASPLTMITTALILAFIVMANLVMVAATDPGIVERKRLHEQQRRPRGEEVAAADSTRTSRPTACSSSSSSVMINIGTGVGVVETKRKYCRVCGVFRPPRSCHCVVCDNCVERFDHHCPWVGHCVGLRNYRFYVMLISSALLFFAYVLAFAWRRVGSVVAAAGSTDAGVLGALIRVAPETVALGLLGVVAVIFLGGLVAFHCYLISVNQTANENFKQRYKGSPNPYDKGVLKNIKAVLFVKLPPSKVDFRAEIEVPCFSGAATPKKVDGAAEDEVCSHGNGQEAVG